MNKRWFRLAALSFLLNSAVFGQACSFPPDTRTWDEVAADFVATEAKSPFNNDDGPRLKALDPKKALKFLLPYLGKQHPKGLRLKAIGALGDCAFQEASPALSAIAKDVSEDEDLRGGSLNPGLRYMKSPAAVETAAAVADDKSRYVRISAYWVLSEHGSDRALGVLEKRIQSKGLSEVELENLINALYYSKSGCAGKIIFSNCDFSTLPNDENLLSSYARIMMEFRIPDAQQTMLRIAKMPGRELKTRYALCYFKSFPREDVVPTLIEYINKHNSEGLYDTVTAFANSASISESSKKTLNEFLTSGKVKKDEN